MPKRPNKLCNFPSCPEYQTEKGYCEKHFKIVSAKYEKQRETAVKRGYTSRWHKLRKWKLNKNPLCEICGIRPEGIIVVEADLVHHIDKNPKNNKEENLQSLCRHCHDEIHKEDRFR